MMARSFPLRSRRAAVVAVTVALAASLVLAGCGSKAKSSSPSDPLNTEDGSQLTAVWPMTGLPVSGDLPKHPVFFVKVDNSSASDPQIGLGSADMVFQELVEGGYTRLAVGFYSKLPKVAGPVRSARATDIGIVLPTGGVLVASGSAPSTVGRLKRTGVNYKSFDAGAPGVYRDANDPLHDSLHSVFVDLPKLSKSLPSDSQPPAPYLPWGSEDQFTGSQPAKKVTVHFSGNDGSTTTFKWNGKTYTPSGGFMKSGDEFQPASVLVLRVKSGNAGYKDLAGNFVPESYFYGGGQATLFHNGQAIRAKWSKKNRAAPVELSTASGPLTVPAGKVWVALLPVNEGSPKLTF